MLFNSLEFGLFLPVVFLLYWFIFQKNLRLQNLFVLAASYFFYGWWDWRFLSLIVFSTTVDFFIGQQLSREKNKRSRKYMLWLSIIANIGLLGVFKYYGFFAQSFSDAFTLLGIPFEVRRLNLILPIGISFYTFQTLSYTIDVYRGKLAPTSDFISFAAFVSFFPQLVAGPIEKAKDLLPQFEIERKFSESKAIDGCRQILWGLFKKIVIADGSAKFINQAFDFPEYVSSFSLITAAVLFSFQIYCDFSGYSDVAIGTSKLFGFKLRKNFDFPYFSRDIAEFWRRWHISLTSWFKDYIYIPLGGSRGNKAKTLRNIFVIFIISGFWHGANWTYIFWGLMNAILFVPLLLYNSNRKHISVVAEHTILPSFIELFRILSMFIVITLTWVLFRAETLQDALTYYIGIFTQFEPDITILDHKVWEIGLYISIMMTAEWINRKGEHGLSLLPRSKYLRYAIYIFVLDRILRHFSKQIDFIYFQF